MGFRVCFTPLTGVLFTVPSRYCSLSVTSCSLPWTVVGPASHRIARVPWYSRSAPHVLAQAVRDSHPLWWAVPGPSILHHQHGDQLADWSVRLTTPLPQRLPPWHGIGLGGGPFRSPLLRAVFCFLRVLRCFSSPTYLPTTPTVVGPQPVAGGVAPFGHGWITAWLPLPIPCAADQRPSSARRAQASSHRASFLAWSLVSRH